DARSHESDLAALDADVALAAQALTRIEHIAVGDDQIELEGGIPGIEAQGCRRRHLVSACRRLSLRHLCAEQPAGRGRRAAGFGGVETRGFIRLPSEGGRGTPMKWLRKATHARRRGTEASSG